MILPSPYAAKLRALNEKLKKLRDELAEQVSALNKEAFEKRLAELREPGERGPVVFFPWNDDMPDIGFEEDPLGGGREGARQRSDTEVEESSGDAAGLPGDSSMIEYTPLSGSGGGGGF